MTNNISTKISRVSVKDIDDILGVPFSVLDFGFVRVIDYMGSDESVVQAARASYGTGTKTLSEDRALINFLLRNGHTSPFEMCEIKLHIKAPIFITRQWLRHRTANINECSARYSVLDHDFFIPEAQEIGMQSKGNKQSRELNDNVNSAEVVDVLRNESSRQYQAYEMLLNEKDVPREIARTCLGVNFYTNFYWKIDLHNLLHFLYVRSAFGAQLEMRKYANIIIENIVKKWVPITYEAFQKYKIDSVSVSSEGVRVLKSLLNGESVDWDNVDMSSGEKAEFKKNFLSDFVN